MAIDWKARSIVNQSIRTRCDSHQTLLMDKSLTWDFGMDREQITGVVQDIEHETDSEVTEEDIHQYSPELEELTVGELYEITKSKLK